MPSGGRYRSSPCPHVLAAVYSAVGKKRGTELGSVPAQTDKDTPKIAGVSNFHCLCGQLLLATRGGQGNFALKGLRRWRERTVRIATRVDSAELKSLR
ncbi:hypothetical protein KL86DES1_21245 [uncultured Desulfovibrio sp.]|uniref:Uncharacterized protein n=1 Tax=uncultured Desulfovibrio sp. TaxID=167968 RepID=A0A212L7P8_9BACT|nr:hypothetical protein KL86DES1_21245 [uncultured Desulfovibrio sp.]